MEVILTITTFQCPGEVAAQDVRTMSPTFNGGGFRFPPRRPPEGTVRAHVRARSPSRLGGGARLAPALPPAGRTTGENEHFGMAGRENTQAHRDPSQIMENTIEVTETVSAKMKRAPETREQA